MSNINTAKFKGHESFVLRRGWIYKGLKELNENTLDDGHSESQLSSEFFIKEDLKQDVFQSKNANVILGIGTNMCKALRYYLRAIGLSDEKHTIGNHKCTILSKLGNFILERDPNLRFLETIALIHLNFSRNYEFATAWYIFFHRIDGSEISLEEFIMATRAYLYDHKLNLVSDKSIADDFACISNSYAGNVIIPVDDDPENILCSPFIELGLIRYSLISGSVIKKTINWQKLSLYFWGGVFLQEFVGKNEILIENLYEPEGCIGRAFNLSRTDILRIADELDKANIVRTIRTSGLDIIRLPDSTQVKQTHINELFSRCYKQRQTGELIKYEY